MYRVGVNQTHWLQISEKKLFFQIICWLHKSSQAEVLCFQNTFNLFPQSRGVQTTTRRPTAAHLQIFCGPHHTISSQTSCLCFCSPRLGSILVQPARWKRDMRKNISLYFGPQPQWLSEFLLWLRSAHCAAEAFSLSLSLFPTHPLSRSLSASCTCWFVRPHPLLRALSLHWTVHSI